MGRKKKDDSGLSLQHKAFADLILCGWAQGVAFRVIFPERNVNANSLPTCCARIVKDPEVAEYMRLQRIKGTGYGANDFDENGELLQIDKETLSKELTTLFRKERDPKLKSEIGMKLADLNQFKKESTEAQQQVKYYIPLPENDIPGYVLKRCETDTQFADNLRVLLDKHSK
ncbi:hypothetical protein DXA95_16265 [Odoribacter sp. OF09-27XD]|jgi:hypothetical protein|nr:hypothetical protein [Odoribacter sp. OF09-27XD]RHV89199.1 hypothetical protein DXA95_16265 [Odoribacter sp. OF09-27XD]